MCSLLQKTPPMCVSRRCTAQQVLGILVKEQRGCERTCALVIGHIMANNRLHATLRKSNELMLNQKMRRCSDSQWAILSAARRPQSGRYDQFLALTEQPNHSFVLRKY